MTIAREVEELTFALSSTERGYAFSDGALETCRRSLAALDPSALAARMTDLLAIALELLAKDAARGELAARQLCELCASLQGRAKSGSDRLAELVRPEDATGQLLGRTSVARAPKLDARAPQGTRKLATFVPPAKKVR